MDIVEEAEGDEGPLIEAFPKLSMTGMDSTDRSLSRQGEEKKQKRRSFRFSSFRTGNFFGRVPHIPSNKHPLATIDDKTTGPASGPITEEAGQGRFSLDYGASTAVLSFSLARGENALETHHGVPRATVLQPIPPRGASAHHVDVIAQIHELEARELPGGTDHQPDRPSIALSPPPACEPAKVMSPGQSPQELFILHDGELTNDEKREMLHYDTIYYFGKSKGTVKKADRREKGEFCGEQGDHIHYRYEIVKLLGKGTFGRVFCAHDHKTGERVAVKVIRNSQRYHRQGLKEVKLLQLLQKEDEHDEHHVVIFHASFTFRNHLCLVFELLEESLYDHMQRHKQAGLSLMKIKAATKQILKALEFLTSLGIVHCDIKPENIMVCMATWRIKVIDFGTSCLASKSDQHTYIQSRFYRAPEVILGLRYSCAIDIWSLGCMLPELVNNQVLFPGESEKQQIAAFCATLGLPPMQLLKDSSRASIYFLKNTSKLVSHAAAYGVIRAPDTYPLTEIIPDMPTDFIDFVRRCLEWDPAARMSAQEALKHNWMAAAARTSPAKVRGKLPSISRSS